MIFFLLVYLSQVDIMNCQKDKELQKNNYKIDLKQEKIIHASGITLRSVRKRI